MILCLVVILCHFFNHQCPLSLPLKLGSNISPTVLKYPLHEAANSSITHTTAGIDISDKYKGIPAIAKIEGKQRSVSFTCKSDTPARHYYLQYQK
jgi:hypothetical protein